MNSWCLILLTFLLSPCQGIDVITSHLDKINSEEVYFEIKDVEPESLDEFTICGRFKTSRFLTSPSPRHTITLGLNSVTVVDCDNSKVSCYFYKQQMGPGRDVKHVFGQIYFEDEDQKTFPPWLPGVWQSFCYAVRNSTIKLTINGHISLRTDVYTGWHKHLPAFRSMRYIKERAKQTMTKPNK